MLTEVELNSKYTSIFQSEDFVVLTKNGESYCEIPEFDSRFFKKDRVCRVIECGLSHFFLDEEYQFIQLVENCEWCSVEAIIEKSEYEFVDKEGFLEGVVRARDLHERTEDYISREYSD